MGLRLNSLLATSLLVGGAQANPHPGQTFSIAEPDTLTEIQERAAKVNWDGLRDQAVNRSQAFVSAQLPLAENDESRMFDPTYTLPRDITDGSGKVLFRKGTQVNVYQRIHDTARYIVIADRPSHYRWLEEVVKPTDQDLVMLANGNVYQARQRTHLMLYLLDDRFIERFGLRRVPSIVHQEGTMVRVQEYALQEKPGDQYEPRR